MGRSLGMQTAQWRARYLIDSRRWARLVARFDQDPKVASIPMFLLYLEK